MRFGDLLGFRKDIFFDGAVQIDWFYNPEKATLVAKNFVFHGKEYHGIPESKDNNLKDTVSFVHEISEKVNNDFDTNPLSLAIATYGTGKSHLAVTLAELLSGPDYNPEAYKAIIENISNIDSNLGREIEQNTQKRHLVLTINGMRDINLNAELLKVAQKSLLLYECSTDNLKKINRALETASRFFERNCVNTELFEKYAVDYGYQQRGAELIDIVRKTLFQNETAFNLVNAAYKDINDADISWDEGISANSILKLLLDDYCGSSGPFDGIVILFDEFGRYLEYASNNESVRTGESALQQIFECTQNAEGRIQVVNFIQSDIKTYLQRIDSRSNISRYIGRFDASDKYYLSSNLETIFANLVQRKDKEAFVTKIANRLLQQENYWEDIYNSLNKWTTTRGIWKYYDKFRLVVVQGIFPMHPLSTFALSQLSSYLQNRSSLFLVSQYFEELEDTIIDPNHSLPCIYPEQLLKGDLFTEILSAEESGRQTTKYCICYNEILAKHRDNLDENCLKVLRANLLLRILSFKTENQEGAIKALGMFSGLNTEEINESLDSLIREYAILGYNEQIGCYDFLENSLGERDFRVFFNRAKSNIVLYKDIFSDSVIRVLADVIEPVSTKFALDNKIKTKEWQFDQDMFYIDELSAGYLNNLKKEYSEAITPDKPKGKLIWLYTNKDMAYSNIEEASKLINIVDGLPIVFMLLDDKEDKLINAIKEYIALRSFSEDDTNRFAQYYNEKLSFVERAISDSFERLKLERICVTNAGTSVLNDRLPICLADIFKSIYTKVLPFDFDGFENSRGKARSIFCKIVRVLFGGRIDDNTLAGLGVDGTGRMNNTLSYNASNSWKCMNEDHLVMEPQNVNCFEVYKLVVDRLVLDEYVSYEDLTKGLVDAPYGMNDHEVLYLMAVVYANLSYCMRVALNGNPITVGDWLDNVLPANSRGSLKIDFRKLLATSFIKKDLAGIEAKFLQLFNKIEASTDLDTIIAGRDKLQELIKQESLPENLADKYKLLNQKFSSANIVSTLWENGIEVQYQKYEKLITGGKSYDIQVALKSIRDIEKGDLIKCFQENGLIPSVKHNEEVHKLLSLFRTAVKPLLVPWISGQRCVKREDITNFASKMDHFAELLRNVGYDEEAKLVAEIKEREKQKPFFKMETVNEKLQQLEDEFKNNSVDDSYGYKRILKLIGNCNELLKLIQEVKPYLANGNEYTNNVQSKLDIAKAVKSKLEDDLSNFENQMYNLSDLDSIRVAQMSINKLKTNDYDEQTVEYLDDVQKYLTNVVDSLEQVFSHRNNRKDFYSSKSVSLQKIQDDLDRLNDDYGHDVSSIVQDYFDSIEKGLDNLDYQWKQKFVEFDFEQASISDVNSIRLDLDTMPAYLKEETKNILEDIKDTADEFIAKHKVNAVVEAFRSLNDAQRMACYDLLKELI